MVRGPAALASSENLSEMQIPGLWIPDPLNQKSWRWGPASYILIIPPGDSDAHSNVRTTVLEKRHQNHLGDF